MSRRLLLILALAGWPACALLWSLNRNDSPASGTDEPPATVLAEAIGEPLSADLLQSLAEIRESMGSPLLASAGAFETFSPEPPKTLLPEGVNLAETSAEEDRQEFVEVVRQAAKPMVASEYSFNGGYVR